MSETLSPLPNPLDPILTFIARVRTELDMAVTGKKLDQPLSPTFQAEASVYRNPIAVAGPFVEVARTALSKGKPYWSTTTSGEDGRESAALGFLRALPHGSLMYLGLGQEGAHALLMKDPKKADRVAFAVVGTAAGEGDVITSELSRVRRFKQVPSKIDAMHNALSAALNAFNGQYGVVPSETYGEGQHRASDGLHAQGLLRSIGLSVASRNSARHKDEAHIGHNAGAGQDPRWSRELALAVLTQLDTARYGLPVSVLFATLRELGQATGIQIGIDQSTGFMGETGYRPVNLNPMAHAGHAKLQIANLGAAVGNQNLAGTLANPGRSVEQAFGSTSLSNLL